MAVLEGFFLVTIQETELMDKGRAAINRAKQLGRPILLSEVQKMEPTDPLLFYQIGKENYFGERFFWKDPSDEIILAGIGISKQIQSDQDSDRFFHVENKWKDFLEESMVLNPFEKNAVGPLMFGGFSFDPYKPKTALWSKFADSLFHIPKYMLSIINGQAFLTTNIVCTQHDDFQLLQETTKERNHLINQLKQKLNAKSAQLIETKAIIPNEWKASVDRIVNDLKADGALKKVVLARELRLYFDDAVEAETVLLRLLKEQHESFIFAFEANGDCFIGASPERLVKKQGTNVFSTCLAGSISRGQTKAEDDALGEELLNDHKNRVEHQYVVGMIKEALEESCEEVILPDEPQLMKMRDIQHLYTPVVGKSKPGTSLLLFVERLHPTPALGGLPKQEAVEKIRQVEEMDRGFYGGPLGWVDYQGDGEFAVSIRSGLIQGKESSLFAGCGVVVNSDSESEFLETGLKFRPMLRALGGK